MTDTVLSPEWFQAVAETVRQAGFLDADVQWSENVKEPASAQEFASEAIFVIANSGMKHTVARQIYEKAMGALLHGIPVIEVFGHAHKAASMEKIWADREILFAAFLAAEDKLEFCGTLPHIGKITKYHLAKNFGVDCAKPDVHLQRLADLGHGDVDRLCRDLATASGYRVATVDLILWRASAIGTLDSRTGAIASA